MRNLTLEELSAITSDLLAVAESADKVKAAQEYVNKALEEKDDLLMYARLRGAVRFPAIADIIEHGQVDISQAVCRIVPFMQKHVMELFHTNVDKVDRS